MIYKYYFSAIQCDKFISKFMRAADVGIEHIGLGVTISFKSCRLLTDEQIEKTIKYLESSEHEKDLKQYLANVKLDRVEVVKGEA